MGPASDIAPKVDFAFYYVIVISLALLLLVTGLMLFFVIKYNKKRHPSPERVTEHAWLEVTWTVIPLIIVMSMFYYGVIGYKYLRTVPADALVVKAHGQMWQWSFEYSNGKKTTRLFVPIDTPVKVVLESSDVIHSFYIPAFRVQQDAVPGLPTYVWFKPERTGVFDVMCAQYCGTGHSQMLSSVLVLEKSVFDAWYQRQDAGEPVVTGVNPAKQVTGSEATLQIQPPPAPEAQPADQSAPATTGTDPPAGGAPS